MGFMFNKIWKCFCLIFCCFFSLKDECCLGCLLLINVAWGRYSFHSLIVIHKENVIYDYVDDQQKHPSWRKLHFPPHKKSEKENHIRYLPTAMYDVPWKYFTKRKWSLPTYPILEIHVTLNTQSLPVGLTSVLSYTLILLNENKN